jgi:hypothetical protein
MIHFRGGGGVSTSIMLVFYYRTNDIYFLPIYIVLVLGYLITFVKTAQAIMLHIIECEIFSGKDMNKRSLPVLR